MPGSYAVAILDYVILNFVSRGCGFALDNRSSRSITIHTEIISARGKRNIFFITPPSPRIQDYKVSNPE